MKLTALEHTCLLIAAGGLGAKVLAGSGFWLYALLGGALVAVGSFIYRKGYSTPV